MVMNPDIYYFKPKHGSPHSKNNSELFLFDLIFYRGDRKTDGISKYGGIAIGAKNTITQISKFPGNLQQEACFLVNVHENNSILLFCAIYNAPKR